MSNTLLFFLILSLGLIAYSTGWRRAFQQPSGKQGLPALPRHYGGVAAVWSAGPALLILLAWFFIEPAYEEAVVIESLPAEIASLPAAQLDLFLNNILLAVAEGRIDDDPVVNTAVQAYLEAQSQGRTIVTGMIVALIAAGIAFTLSKMLFGFHARKHLETVIKGLLALSSAVAIFTTLGIVLSVLFESIRFFDKVPVFDFMFGTVWSPQTAIRADQVGSSGSFGAIPLFAGTLLISAIAMCIAVPVGLMSAIYLSDYASPKFRAVSKPALEILAGIPTVVYGFFAALTVAPFVRQTGEAIGLTVASESALAAGVVMGVMIIPFVSSLSDDVINAVPQAMRDGSLGLGATKSETIKQVVIPAALPGIVGGVLLAVSRAIGETMIVVMAAGLAAKLTANPLDAVTTVTVQIVTLLVGDQEFDSAKTLSAFALGLMLFGMTLVLNVIALHVVRKYREQYE